MLLLSHLSWLQLSCLPSLVSLYSSHFTCLISLVSSNLSRLSCLVSLLWSQSYPFLVVLVLSTCSCLTYLYGFTVASHLSWLTCLISLDSSLVSYFDCSEHVQYILIISVFGLATAVKNLSYITRET